MQFDDGVRGGEAGEVDREPVLLHLQRRKEPAGILLGNEALRESLQHAFPLRLDLANARGDPLPLGATTGREALPLGVVSLEVEVDCGPATEMIAEPGQDLALDRVEVVGPLVLARARVEKLRADDARPPVVDVLLGHAAPAHRAAQQAGQQVLRLAAVLRDDLRSFDPERLDGFEQFGLDDA